MNEQIHFDSMPLSSEQVESKFINELANGSGGIARRTALAVLRQSSREFYNHPMNEETAEALLDSVEGISNYIDTLQAHISIMEAARARIFLVLQHHFPEQES